MDPTAAPQDHGMSQSWYAAGARCASISPHLVSSHALLAMLLQPAYGVQQAGHEIGAKKIACNLPHLSVTRRGIRLASRI